MLEILIFHPLIDWCDHCIELYLAKKDNDKPNVMTNYGIFKGTPICQVLSLLNDSGLILAINDGIAKYQNHSIIFR